MRVVIDFVVLAVEAALIGVLWGRFFARRYEALGYTRGMNDGLAKGAEAFQDIMNDQVLPLLVRHGVKPVELSDALGMRVQLGCKRPDCAACAARRPHVNN